MELIEMLSKDSTVIMAARVANTFHLDPIAVLDDSGDTLLNMLRVAATIVVQRDEEESARKAKAGARKR